MGPMIFKFQDGHKGSVFFQSEMKSKLINSNTYKHDEVWSSDQYLLTV